MLREAASAAKPASGAPAGAGAPMTPPAPLPIPAVPIPRAPSFAFGAQGAHPPAGAAPVAAAPQPPTPPPPQSKLQAYLPVLLIINAFVLAVLILLVLFALRHH
jgi:hypothetical protein